MKVLTTSFEHYRTMSHRKGGRGAVGPDAGRFRIVSNAHKEDTGRMARISLIHRRYRSRSTVLEPKGPVEPVGALPRAE